MPDLVINLALWWAPVAVMVVVLPLLRRAQLRPTLLAAALLTSILYVLAIQVYGDLIPVERLIADPDWNWNGKVASILTTLVLVFVFSLLFREVSRTSTGFTLRQNAGSVLPALGLIIVCVGALIALAIWRGDGPANDAERLWYQATMPGFDEEPHYRGLLLVLLNEAFGGKKWKLFGAPLGWGALATTLIFALGHGLGLQNGELIFVPEAVVLSGLLAFALVWIRERTGSLLLPVLGHNAMNFVPSFF